MMRFGPQSPRRGRRENIVPMINVVFLLLIFFLMSAQIAPPPPVDLTLPQSDAADQNRAANTLYVAQDGALYLNETKGEGVFAQAASLASQTPLRIEADAQLPAQELASLLQKLAAAGVTDISLVTGAR